MHQISVDQGPSAAPGQAGLTRDGQDCARGGGGGSGQWGG